MISGYSGGHVKNPTYEQVTAKGSGHVEAVQVTYNPKQISYVKLMDTFWMAPVSLSSSRRRAASG